MAERHIVILGWKDASGTGDYKPFCDPPHVDASRRLKASMSILRRDGEFNGATGDALWLYDGREQSLRRYNNRVWSVGSMLDRLGPTARTVIEDRDRLVAMLSPVVLERLTRDARAIVNEHRAGIRTLLGRAENVTSMFDCVATLTVGRAFRQTASAEWKEGRLHLVVPGIPDDHDMREWREFDDARIAQIRSAVTDMLSG